MARIKFVVVTIMLIVTMMLSPVSYVLADETEGKYSEDVPYMKGISAELIRFDLNPFNYKFAETNKQMHIKRIEFRFDRQSSIDYSDYEFVFDFRLKTQLESGAFFNTRFEQVIDGASKDGTVSHFDEILIYFDLKDDYFSWSFDYEDLVSRSIMLEVKKDLLGQKSYNTVVTSVECYIRRKADSDYGLISRFDFVWYEDFYKQNCSKISYSLIVPETEDVLDSGSVEHNKFAAKFDSDGSNWFYKISNAVNQFTDFLVSLPEMIYAVISGVFGIYSKIILFLKMLFPFIPGVIFDAFGVIIVISISVAVWYFVRGG